MATILIAEDDQVLADGLLRSLRAAGYAADQVSNGSEADAALADHEFDCVILDLGLPKMHGLDVLRRMRARGSSVPVLILTAADSVEQRVKGLDLGADDYMAKPFSLQELEARVRALTRRGLGSAATIIKHGPLSFDATGRVAYINDQMIELSARELSLAAEGVIGKLAPRFHGAPTDYSHAKTNTQDAPELLRRLREDKVDAAVLTAL